LLLGLSLLLGLVGDRLPLGLIELCRLLFNLPRRRGELPRSE
jgi:hypothetical protein